MLKLAPARARKVQGTRFVTRTYQRDPNDAYNARDPIQPPAETPRTNVSYTGREPARPAQRRSPPRDAPRDAQSVGRSVGEAVGANVDAAAEAAGDVGDAIAEGLDDMGRQAQRQFDATTQRVASLADSVEDRVDDARRGSFAPRTELMMDTRAPRYEPMSPPSSNANYESPAVPSSRSEPVVDPLESQTVDLSTGTQTPQTQQDWGYAQQKTVPAGISVEVKPTPDPRFEEAEIKKVLVAGASGGVGRKVVAQLAAKGIHVIALVRDASKARQALPWPAQGVTVIEGDVYKYSSLPRALKGCDAVVVATGARDPIDPLGPFNVDYNGTVNLVAASKAEGIKRFVYVTSIGTDDPIVNPLNLFWGVLFWKKRAEEYLQRSGLSYTIVRPGGLVADEVDAAAQRLERSWNRDNSSRGQGNVVMASAGTYGLPPKKLPASIKRSKVAECCVEALVQSKAADKVVEIVADRSAPAIEWEYLFDGVSF